MKVGDLWSDLINNMATSSGPVEMDAMFIKALKLLHSRHPDSLEQLRALRDEAIRQYSQQVPPSKTAKEKTKEMKSSTNSDRRPSAISAGEVKPKSADKKYEGEIKQTIPAKQANMERRLIDEASVETLEIGSSMVETVELSSSSLMDHSLAKKAKLQFDVEAVLDEGDLDSQSSLQPVVEDLMIDIGSVCGICYREESKILGNQLVECHECHSLYHQRCHEPRVMDSEVNDPRHVWYCGQCVRRMREMASSTSPKTRPAETTTSCNSKPLASTSRPNPMTSFKRPSISDVKPSSSTAMHQSFAIPALSTSTMPSAAAAALGSKPSTSGGSSSSQNIAMQSALKRLQMVKKKAQQRVLNHQQIRIPRR